MLHSIYSIQIINANDLNAAFNFSFCKVLVYDYQLRSIVSLY